MTTATIELTDTFGGQANFSWSRRETFDVDNLTDRQVELKARALVGLTGVRTTRSDYGNKVRWDVQGACICAFLTFAEPETITPNRATKITEPRFPHGLRQHPAADRSQTEPKTMTTATSLNSQIYDAYDLGAAVARFEAAPSEITRKELEWTCSNILRGKEALNPALRTIAEGLLVSAATPDRGNT